MKKSSIAFGERNTRKEKLTLAPSPCPLPQRGEGKTLDSLNSKHALDSIGGRGMTGVVDSRLHGNDEGGSGNVGFLDSREVVSQFVIPAKSRIAGCEPESRDVRDNCLFLDSGSHFARLCSSGMTF